MKPSSLPFFISLAVGGIVVGIAIFITLSMYCASKIRWRERVRRGLCGRCGYDLRASRQRCPECGEPIETESVNPISPNPEQGQVPSPGTPGKG
jgi:hypothetical protein